MTFEQLHYFTESYRQKFLGKAAANLYVSRQSLSTSIRKIEQELGVTLFVRSASGISPTPTGHELYHHAQAILEKYSILKQSMSSYSKYDKPLEICKINISESLISCYGDTLLDALSDSFPQTYFDFSLYSLEKSIECYHNFDITIKLMSEQTLNQHQKNIPDNYLFKLIKTIPVYIWIDNSSPLNISEIIPFEKLKDYPSCCLKNSYSSINFNAIFGSLENNMHIIELERNFISNIERFGYYTIDIPLQHGNFIYANLFSGHNVFLKRTSLLFYLGVIYRKKTCEHFYPIIANVLTDNL